MTTPDNTVHVEATAEIGAAAPDVYRAIADYEHGHPHIIPPHTFSNLRVIEGGYGAGTLIGYDMRALGKTRHARARVTEPQPGRVLVETELDMGAVTTFTVEPLPGARSRVTIATDLPTRGGFLGRIERAIIRSFLGRVYTAELAQLAAFVA